MSTLTVNNINNNEKMPTQLSEYNCLPEFSLRVYVEHCSHFLLSYRMNLISKLSLVWFTM